MMMDESHFLEQGLKPFTDNTNKKNDGEKTTVGCEKRDKKSSFRDLYKVNWEVVVGKGSLGTVYRGRCISDDTDVVITLLKEKVTTENLYVIAHNRLGLLRRHWPPDTVQFIGGYRLATKDFVTVVFVLRLHGVDDISSFFSVKLSKTEGEEGNTMGLTQGQVSGKNNSEEVKEEGIGPQNIKHADPGSGDKTAPQLPQALLSTGVREKVWSVGCYEVNKADIIGRGKFGIVYRGRHQSEGFDVAVKVVCGPMRKLTRLLMEVRELESLQALRHPNILRLFKAFQKVRNNEVTLVLILELCHGGDLREFLAQHDPLSEWQARRIMRQLVHFLLVMKKHQMMHRDLKPANILLTSPIIDDTVVKVADWGMAKRSGMKGGGGGDPNPESGGLFESAVGTVAYMSPERLACDFYDFQAEVWALGVIMYELLFARHPYLHRASSVRTPEQLLEAITRAQELELAAKVCCQKTKEQEDTLIMQQQSPLPHRRSGEGPLSLECYNLMRCMLDPKPKSRYTIEQVEAHPWFLCKEPLFATEEVKAEERPFETVTMGSVSVAKAESEAEATTAGKTLSTAPIVGVTISAQQLFPVDDDMGGVNIQRRGGNWGIPQRQQAICQALREYIHVLRYDVIEEEIDIGRGLVLLSYAWELFRTAIKAVWLEEHVSGDATTGLDTSNTVPSSAWAALRVALPDDIRQIETYIQDTSERLRRNLPVVLRKKPLSAQMINFSTTSMPGVDTPSESFLQSESKVSNPTYPTAHTILFQRAVLLIRMAASEELMLSGTDDQENFMGTEEMQSESERCRRQCMYEQAMSILRLFLQQVVVQKKVFSNSLSTPNTTEGEQSRAVQVMTIPLVPAKEEADQRTVQALLHKVEKYYSRFVKVK